MKNVYIKTLGCPKNEVDSYEAKNTLFLKGYNVIQKPHSADIIILNTCAFVEDARVESKEELEKFLGLKDKGKIEKLVVTGCLAEQERDYLRKSYPSLDGVLGNRDLNKIGDFLTTLEKKDETISWYPDNYGLWYDDEKDTEWVPDSYPYAYIKIADGCDNKCSYCLLPEIKGPFRSVPMERILKKIRLFVNNGYKEVILVAQDTALYGTDLYGEQKLDDLIKEIDNIEEDFWIRVMYAHPAHIYDDLISVMADAEKVIPYIDMPIQHISNDILERMDRQITAQEIESLIGRFKEDIPDIHMRSTLLVGFPGETKKDFNELMDFVEKKYFHHLGVFAYSKEDGTPAYDFSDHVPTHVAYSRKETLEFIQRDHKLKDNKNKVGRKFRILANDAPCRPGFFWGRLKYDAPEVDRYIKVKGNIEDYSSFHKVKVMQALDNDLLGVKIDDT